MINNRSSFLILQIKFDLKALELTDIQARKSTEKPRSSQLKLLAGAVKRKGDAGVKEVVKVQKVEQQENGGKVGNGKANAHESPPSKGEGGGGGGLLGLGGYGSDSDSD